MPRARPPHRPIRSALFRELARIGQALASPARLELLDLLAQAERPVEELAALTGAGLANVSAHLQVLHRAGLVERRRQGRQVRYRLADPAVLTLVRSLETTGRTRLDAVDRLVRDYYQDPAGLEPVSPRALHRRLTEGDVLVLDVRPLEEYRAGHIPGAVSLPPDEVRRRLRRLPRDQEIVAYCRGPLCLFSVDAAALIRASGRAVRRLATGFPDWEAAGLPVARGDQS